MLTLILWGSTFQPAQNMGFCPRYPLCSSSLKDRELLRAVLTQQNNRSQELQYKAPCRYPPRRSSNQ